MQIYLLAFFLGVVAGLRSLTPLAAVSWAAHLGLLYLDGTWLAFLGYKATPYILTEIINDKLPKTPSRKAPGPFAVRIVTGALSGAAVGAAGQAIAGGLIAGIFGAVAGTLGGYEFRARLVRAIGRKDLPIALIEDVIAIGFAIWLIALIP
jgi:uncharacterized membrane protein